MSFMDVLFQPNGRITQGQFWAGWGVLFAGNIIANIIPFIGIIISLGLIYVGCCVYGKRLHDMGKSAWLHAIPWAIGLVLGIIGIFGMLPALMRFVEENPDTEPTPEVILGMMGPMMIFLALSLLVWIAYTIWVGVSRSQPGDNKYGPEPGMASAPDMFG